MKNSYVKIAKCKPHKISVGYVNTEKPAEHQKIPPLLLTLSVYPSVGYF